MQIKSFIAADMPQALDRVRESLGPDAILLHTRMISRAGERRVEIMAALDPVSVEPNCDAHSIDRQAWRHLETEIHGARSRINSLEQGEPLAVWLARTDFLPSVAKQLTQRVAGESDVYRAIQQALTEKIQCTDGLLPLPDQPRRIALVGPPGVGKTTALVKLAASASASSRSDVVLINLDTYRPGAEEYLAQVSDTLRVPVLSDRTREVQKGLPEADGLVLIDTDSHIWTSDPGAVALRSTLGRLRPDAIALVLPATWRAEDLKDALQRFHVVAPTHLVFSSLDQTIRYGGILSAAWLAKRPVACVSTTGRFDSGTRLLRVEALMQQMRSLWPAVSDRKEENRVE
jgi:flagellar biosynthesis protein FlhF